MKSWDYRRSSSFNTQRIEHLYIEELIQDFKSKRNIFLHYGDMTDATNLIRLFQEIKPDEVYNLAAQSHVKALIYQNIQLKPTE